MIDDKYNISCVKWDISFFDGLDISAEKLNKYMGSHPRTFSDLFRIVLLYKFGGSYIDTDDLAIKKFDIISPNRVFVHRANKHQNHT